jgi:glyoxylase-like metal-dependent hydrolase (beta-lactamase superfamily II)
MNEAATGSAQAPGFYRFKVGAYQAVALHDGVVQRDRPPGFVRNAPDDVVGEAFAAAGMPRDKLTITFTALAVETGSGVVVIDTGMGEAGPSGTGKLEANLAAAGIRPGDVTHVVISHFHGDHISGLRRKDGSLTFPKAEVIAPAVEWDYWMDDARQAAAADGLKPNFDLVRRMFGSIAADVRRFAWDDEVLPGIIAIQASGHTPGMTAFQIASGGDSVLFVADITNNPMLFVRNPEWQAMFDMNPEEAVATRRRILDRAAAEKQRLFFFHAPFPGIATVVKTGDRYEYLPALWTAP